MDLGLAGKTVVITGGASNIGRSISLTFVKEGANVVIAELDEAQAQKVVKEANALGGGRTITLKTDVTDDGQVEALVKKILDEFDKIDVLVNVVGWTFDRLFVEKPREEWEKEIKLNFWSDINCIRAVLPHMIERKSGNIVSIGSDAGRIGEYREAVYGGCKAAVISMSKSIAREVGRYGIRLNTVCPSLTIPENPQEETGEMSMARGTAAFFTPETLQKAASKYALRKLGKPQDIANMVVFLASDAVAGHVTGQTISVNGGYIMP